MTTKICRTCGAEPSIPGSRPICRSCKRKYDNAWHQTNKNRTNASRAARGRRRYEVTCRFLYDYLISHPCVDCGETDPIVLDFDHQEDKRIEVTRMYRHSTGSLLKEIAKCLVRCSNCHRKKTAREAGHFRYVWSLGSGSLGVG